MSVYNRKSWIHNGVKHWIYRGKHYTSRIKRKKRFKTGKIMGKMRKKGFWIFKNFENKGIKYKTKSWIDFENEFYRKKTKNDYEEIDRIIRENEEFERRIYIDSQIYDLDGY